MLLLALSAAIDMAVELRVREPLRAVATQISSSRFFEVVQLQVFNQKVLLSIIVDTVQRRVLSGIEIPAEGCSWEEGFELLCQTGLLARTLFIRFLVRLTGRDKYLAVRFPDLYYDGQLNRKLGQRAILRVLPRG